MKVLFEANQILQSMPCACPVFDDKGRVEFVNPFLCQILGYSAEEILGHNFEEMLPIASRLFYQTHFFPLLRLNGRVNEIFLMLRSKSGESIPVMIKEASTTAGQSAGFDDYTLEMAELPPLQ